MAYLTLFRDPLCLLHMRPRLGAGYASLAFFILVVNIAHSVSAQQATQAPAGASQPATATTTVQGTPQIVGIQILSPKYGVAFGPYMVSMRTAVTKTWAEAAASPSLPQVDRELSVEFWVKPDGNTEGLAIHDTSGVDALDQAAIKAIREASPFGPLPARVGANRVNFRFYFVSDLAPRDHLEASRQVCYAALLGPAPGPPLDRVDVIGLMASPLDPQYVERTLCQRGISFIPNDTFLSTIKHYGPQARAMDSLAALKPKTIAEPSPERARAYQVLDFTAVDENHGPYLPDTELFAKALEFAPDSAPLHSAYARRQFATKNYSEAEAHDRKALALWPDDEEANLQLAVSLLALHRAAEAVGPARDAARVAPTDTIAQYMLGSALLAAMQYHDAIDPLCNALPLARQIPVLYKNLGSALVHSGEFDEAIEPLTNYLKTSPDDAEAHYILGAAYRGMGKKDDAVAQFREAVRLRPSEAVYAVALERIDPSATVSAPPKPDTSNVADGFFTQNTYTNRFFDFSYEFPVAWTILPERTGTTLLRVGDALIAGSDPIMADTAEAAGRRSVPLLVVAKTDARDLTPKTSLIQISAFEAGAGPQAVTPEALIQAVSKFQPGTVLSGASFSVPAQASIGGKVFWRVNIENKLGGTTVREDMLATSAKGHVILIVFSSAEPEVLSQMEGTLRTLKFNSPTP
jgi:TonB family protein